MRYLRPTDPDAFKDWEVIPIKETVVKNPVLCPLCLGHGGWNLRLDAYTPRPGMKNHFTCFCDSCWGEGYVEKDSLNHKCFPHEWERKTIGRCLHEWKCQKCGQLHTVDSSD